MPTSCSAFGCSNHNLKPDCVERKVSFHNFPHSNLNLMKAWLVNVKRENFVPSKSTKLCSDHFDPKCFIQIGENFKRVLGKDAVPTNFSFSKTSKRKRTSYTTGCIENEADSDPCEGTSSSTATQTQISFNFLIDELQLKNAELEGLKSKVGGRFNPESMSNKEILALCGVERENFFKFYEFLNLTNDLNEESLPVLQQYFFFMLCLKTGITLDFVAYIFQVSKSTASRTFIRVVDVILQKLKRVDIWPSREQIKEFMPYGFLIKYPECRVIIDCTEFAIQQPFKTVQQQLTFSHYKNKNTTKALVGIAPSGGITYISDLWCGSISDKEIFKRSKLPQILQRGDVVLADKGFKIEDELDAIGVKLSQPLFLENKIQFSLEERAHNKSVSNLRVHVERAISRIKIFKYFEGAVPFNSLHNLNGLLYCIFLN